MTTTIYSPTKSGTIKYRFADTQFGRCLVAYCKDGICEIFFTAGSDEEAIAELRSRWTDTVIEDGCNVIKTVCNESVQPKPAAENTYEIWFTDNKDCKLCLVGTPLQRQVWALLTEIPYGTTVSYTDIAARLGRPHAVRAVATAIAANKVALLIPCHRVVRSDGSISGYRWGSDRKKAILEWEKNN